MEVSNTTVDIVDAVVAFGGGVVVDAEEVNAMMRSIKCAKKTNLISNVDCLIKN